MTPRALMAHVLCVAMMTGCGTVQSLWNKPEVRSVAVTVTHLDFEHVELRFDVEVHNPASARLVISGYDYDLRMEGQPVLTGMSAAGFDLAPHATSKVPVPLSVKYAEMSKKLSPFKDRQEVAYSLAVALMIDAPAGAYRVPFHKEGRMPMLTLPQVRLQAIRIETLGLHGMSLEAVMEVSGLKSTSIALKSLSYHLAVNGTSIATSTIDSIKGPVSGESLLVRMPIQLDLAKAMPIFEAALSSGSELQFSFDGHAQFTSPYGALSLPFKHSGKLPLVK